jgi:hypothetical protein
MNKLLKTFFIFLTCITSNMPPLTAMYYDTLTNNRILLEHLKKIPVIIKESIDNLNKTHQTVETWQLPELTEQWNPRTYPYAAATVQGCFLELHNDIPRAIITPWGRIILVIKGHNKLFNALAPSIYKRIILGDERTDIPSSCSATNEEMPTFFELKAIDSLECERAIPKKYITEALADKLDKLWDQTVEKESSSREPEITTILKSSPYLKPISEKSPKISKSDIPQ